MSDVEQTVEAPKYQSPLADPIMNGKLLERSMKLIKKAMSEKSVKRGVPETTKAIRKGQKGLVLIAGDVFPLDICAHLPAFCEEKDIAYAYVPSRMILGQACNSKRACSTVFVAKPKAEAGYEKSYTQVHTGIAAINSYM